MVKKMVSKPDHDAGEGKREKVRDGAETARMEKGFSFWVQ